MHFPFSVMPENQFDVVGFGTNAVDYLIRVPHFPKFDSKVELTEYTVAPGGEVASSMVALSRLGFKTSYVGRFGADEAGAIGTRSLTSEGVDISFSETISGARTQVAFILVDDHSGERTVIWQRDEKLAYNATTAPVAAVAGGRILHLTPHDAEACLRMGAAAKDAGLVVSADVDNIFDGLFDLLPLLDICIVSAELPARLVSIEDPHDALREMSRRFGCGVTGITLGESGSLLFCQNEFVETAGYQVPGGCADTTGAGDAFRAGFLFGVLSGFTVEQSASAANGVAALKCRGYGARSTLPDRGELDLLLKKI